MHTRRLAAFLIGAWLIGTLITSYVSTQAYATVERILSSPPGPVAKDLEYLGTDITRQLLRFEAAELDRFLAQVWGVIQLGLAAALLASGMLTAHRSRFVIAASAIMGLIVAYQIFLIQPSLNALGRSFDFLPPGAAQRERENFQRQEVWWSVFEVLKIALGVAVSARLLFDRYNWRDKVMPKSKKHLRRRHRSAPDKHTGSELPAAPSGVNTEASAERD